jgi:hypothetical protein
MANSHVDRLQTDKRKVGSLDEHIDGDMSLDEHIAQKFRGGGYNVRT